LFGAAYRANMGKMKDIDNCPRERDIRKEERYIIYCTCAVNC
jgi:hypothetical protein